ncbi:plasmid replication protein RepC [Rhizobium sp. SG2393]|uniref:plasmid replication protein RepC n=1 Tax=Rhizobium sp. SG2393 TaxID=3276279 RepID=UPI0036725893
MESGIITTPFGRRPMTLGMIRAQAEAARVPEGARIDKWKLFRALCVARPRFNISDRALGVLDALLTFHPKAELAEGEVLVVFPSNAQLSVRAHGVAPATLRRHLAALVDAGLITRKDSPNGKRYARKGEGGAISEAFGFSLAPLLARAEEIEVAAADVEAERLRLRALREGITICRRDIVKLMETALDNGLGLDATAIQLALAETARRLRARLEKDEMEVIAKELADLRDATAKRLLSLEKTEKSIANESRNERHIQNSNPNPTSELEPLSEKGEGGSAQAEKAGSPAAGRAFPLSLVLSACPAMIDYGPGGTIASWRDMMTAAVVVRSMLGVSPSAYQEACEVLGPENAATAIACILERGGHINAPGGYLRDLTRRAARGEFSLGPMLMAQVRANAPGGRRTG